MSHQKIEKYPFLRDMEIGVIHEYKIAPIGSKDADKKCYFKTRSIRKLALVKYKYRLSIKKREIDNTHLGLVIELVRIENAD